MKRLINNLLVIFFLGGILLFTSCKKDGKMNYENSGLTKESLDLDKINIPKNNGSIGLVVDVRPIIKKGYTVSKVRIDVEGSLSSYSKTLEVDQFTNLAILKIMRDSLSKSQLEQFGQGVKTIIIAFDKTNNEIAKSTEASLLFNDSGEPFPMETDKSAIVPPLKILEGVPYYIQKLPNFKEDIELVLTLQPKPLNQIGPRPYMGKLLTSKDIKLQTFFIESVGKGSPYYYIRSALGDYLDIFKGTLESFTDKPPNLKDNYKFQFLQDSEGKISIKPMHGNILVQGPYNDIQRDPTLIKGAFLWNHFRGTEIKFRLITANIEWDVRDLGTVYNDPIMPPVKLEFAFNNLLKNCSNATLHESIGIQDTRTTTYTVGSEESFQLTSSHEASVGITSSMKASASFSGIGVEASVEVSANYTYTNSMTETKSKNFSNTTQKEVQVSRIRELVLPPYSAVKVYDAVETYRNIKIPFIQKLRVSGKLDDNRLTGDEIVSQLLANQFGGLITDIGVDHVIVSVRGSAHIDNLMKASTSADGIPNACIIP